MNIYGSLNYDIHGRKRRQLADSSYEHKARPLDKVDTTVSQAAENHREKYPSGDCFGRTTAKKEANVYSGSYVKGLATMHKSNIVPVGSADPKDYSQMRRT